MSSAVREDQAYDQFQPFGTLFSILWSLDESILEALLCTAPIINLNKKMGH